MTGYLIKTQRLTADLMTQVWSHGRKFTCAEVRNVRRCGVGFTPVACNGMANVCGRNKNQKVHCHPNWMLSDDGHHDEDELDAVVGGYHFHPVFGSTRAAPSLNL